MTLYGYAREPDSTDNDGDPPPQVPLQRATSAPVAVPSPAQPPTTDVRAGALGQPPAADAWAPVPDPASESGSWTPGAANPTSSDYSSPAPEYPSVSDYQVTSPVDPASWSSSAAAPPSAPAAEDLWGTATPGQSSAPPSSWSSSSPADQPAGYGYPDQPAGYGYPDQPAGYGYPDQPAAAGYPDQPAAAGYPDQPAAAGYPDQSPGYGDQASGYSQHSSGYADPSPGYADPSPGYADPSAGYPEQSSGYEEQAPGYADLWTPAPPPDLSALPPDPGSTYGQPSSPYAEQSDPHSAWSPSTERSPVSGGAASTGLPSRTPADLWAPASAPPGEPTAADPYGQPGYGQPGRESGSALPSRQRNAFEARPTSGGFGLPPDDAGEPRSSEFNAFARPTVTPSSDAGPPPSSYGGAVGTPHGAATPSSDAGPSYGTAAGTPYGAATPSSRDVASPPSLYGAAAAATYGVPDSSRAPATVSAATQVPTPGPTATGAATASVPAAAQAEAWAASVPDLDDDDEIIPWDRRPLMIVIAGGIALIILAILSGFVTVQLLGRTEPPAAWRDALPPIPGGPSTDPSPAPGSAAPAASGAITLSGVGDVIMGTEPNKLPPNGGSGMFDSVKSALAADVVMGNLETPLSADTGRSKCGTGATTPPAGKPTPTASAKADCFQFFLPPSYANHLHDAGFTVMNLANNHTNDMGAEGLSNTRKALETAAIKHCGAPNEITVVQAKGLKVAVLGFSVYSWGQSLNNIPAATELVHKAAAQADLVVIQMQGGAEGADKTHVVAGKETYLREDRGDLMKFSHAVIDAGADVVFGHGPHVMRGMEFYKGRLIAYSLGNFTGYGVLSASGNLGVGGVLRVSLNKDGSWAGGQLIPTAMVNGGLPGPDPQKRALDLVNGLSKTDFGAAAVTVSGTDGKITPPAA